MIEGIELEALEKNRDEAIAALKGCDSADFRRLSDTAVKAAEEYRDACQAAGRLKGLPSLTIRATIVDGDDKTMGSWYTGVHLTQDGAAINGDEAHDRLTMQIMTDCLLDKIWEALGIEHPMDRARREDDELIAKLRSEEKE